MSIVKKKNLIRKNWTLKKICCRRLSTCGNLRGFLEMKEMCISCGNHCLTWNMDQLSCCGG